MPSPVETACASARFPPLALTRPRRRSRRRLQGSRASNAVKAHPQLVRIRVRVRCRQLDNNATPGVIGKGHRERLEIGDVVEDVLANDHVLSLH